MLDFYSARLTETCNSTQTHYPDSEPANHGLAEKQRIPILLCGFI